MQTQPLSYQKTGSGPDVVLLHGFLESPAIWKDFIEATVGKVCCINVQMPNHQVWKQDYYCDDLSEQAKLLYQTLIKAKAETPIIIGHSLGGYLALAFIDRYPDFASGIALVNSTCLADTNEQIKRRIRAIKLIETHPNAFISMAIKNLFHKTYLENHKTAISQLVDKAKRLSPHAIQASLAAMRDRTDTSETLRDFDKKKVFIYGTNDPLIPLEASERAIRKSNCPSIALNAGHMSWLEDKKNLHRALLEFIGR